MTAVARRSAARLAPAVWLVTMLLVGWAMPLRVVAATAGGSEDLGNAPNVVLVAVANASLGAIIVRRRPTHPIGWLLLVGSGLLSAMHLLTWSYAAVGPDRARGAALAAWIALPLQTASVMSVVVVFHLYPTGGPVSSRWRVLIWACIVGLAPPKKPARMLTANVTNLAVTVTSR